MVYKRKPCLKVHILYILFFCCHFFGLAYNILYWWPHHKGKPRHSPGFHCSRPGKQRRRHFLPQRKWCRDPWKLVQQPRPWLEIDSGCADTRFGACRGRRSFALSLFSEGHAMELAGPHGSTDMTNRWQVPMGFCAPTSSGKLLGTCNYWKRTGFWSVNLSSRGIGLTWLHAEMV